MRAETAAARDVLRGRTAACVLWLSISLHLLSLSQIAVCLDPGACYRGWEVLAFGWLGIGRLANLTWLANPLLFFGWLFAPSGPRFLAVSFCGAALMSSGAFLFATEATGSGPGGVLREADLVSRGAGYWLWLASSATALAAALLFPRSKLQWS